MNKIEESLNYKKYRTLCKIPDDILKANEKDNINSEKTVVGCKKIKRKYYFIGIVVIIVFLGLGFGLGLGGKKSTENVQVANIEDEQEYSVENMQEDHNETVIHVGNDNVLMKEYMKLSTAYDGTYYVFDTEIDRKSIQSITFMNTVEYVPESYWDVSQDKNGNVLLWIEERDGLYDMFIASEGGVKGNEFCLCLFAAYPNLKTIDFNNCFDTSDVTNMAGMFSGCSSLAALDISNWDTSNVTNMQFMFYGCDSLKMLEVGNWNISSVQNMECMFSYCNNLTTLDVSNWDTRNVVDMKYMFSHCNSLTTLDVSNWIISDNTDTFEMFLGCNIDLSDQFD